MPPNPQILSPEASSLAEDAAFLGIVALTATWWVAALGAWFGLALGRWAGLLGVVVGLVAAVRLRGLHLSTLKVVLFAIGGLVGAFVLAAATVDNSFDGWLYHQVGVIGLAHGWNPVAKPSFDLWWTSHRTDFGLSASSPAFDGRWTTAYPKAIWWLAAQPLVWGFGLEVGKYAGFLLIGITALTARRALRLNGLTGFGVSVGALLAALNPVALCQSTTFYVDGALASCLTILACSLVNYGVTRSSRDLVSALCAALIACNTKFTGPLYVALTVAPVTMYWLSKRCISARHGVVIAVAFVGLLAASINPYLTNFRLGGSPVYPLNQIDVMRDQMSPAFLQKPRLEKLYMALTFSSFSDHFAADPTEREDALQSPLQRRSWREFIYLGERTDLHFGGFGPLFGVVLCLCALAMFGWRWARVPPVVGLVGVGLLLSILPNPEFWWARYVPQFWLLPLVIAAITRDAGARAARVAVSIAVCLMAITVGTTSIGRGYSAMQAARTYEASFQRIGDQPLLINLYETPAYFLPTTAYRLHERGVVMQLTRAPCEQWIDLLVVNGCLKARVPIAEGGTGPGPE